MGKLAWVSIFLCILSGASLAADPNPAEKSGTPGGASTGAGAGISSHTAMVITATAVVVVTGAVAAAIVSSSNGATPTTRH